MEATIRYRSITTEFNKTKEVNDRYDGSFTIKCDWQGRNPLLHKQLKVLANEIKPILFEKGIKSIPMNCNWGEWRNMTFQYVKEDDCQFIFDTFVSLLSDILTKDVVL